MSKLKTSWHSSRLDKEVSVVRWGEIGTPVLIFPTAAADAEEIERFHLIGAVSELLEQGRIKIYSIDSVAGKAWLTESSDIPTASRVQNQFDEFIVEEVVPAIRTDCNDDEVEIVVAGSSIGAFNALAAICRHPDLFSTAICMSGTYGLEKLLEGQRTREYMECSPLEFLPNLPEGPQLEKLRERFILLTHGQGKWEEPAQSWRAADALGAREIPNRVDAWDEEWNHDWPTWRNMLPKYLDEFVPAALEKPIETPKPAKAAMPAKAPKEAEPAEQAKPGKAARATKSAKTPGSAKKNAKKKKSKRKA